MGACHALDPGSIPGRRVFILKFIFEQFIKINNYKFINFF